MNPQIKPCPFCGCEDAELADSEVPKIDGRGKKQAVFCNSCFCEGPTADHESDALELWNRRFPGWMDIESAPVNQSVLIYIPNAEHYGPGIYRGMLVDMGTGKRWMTTALSMGRDCGETWSPTHWMPLPAAPDAKG